MTNALVVVTNDQKPKKEKHVTLGPALDALGEALRAAEQYIFELNFGVEGCVLIARGPEEDSDGDPTGEIAETYLLWGKHYGKWCLYLGHGIAGDGDLNLCSLSQASVEDRKLAASNLPSLLQELRRQTQAQVKALLEATEIALKFARGEFDNVEA